MKTKQLHLLLFFNLLFSPVWSQIPGGMVNRYVKVTAVQPDCGHITVTSGADFSDGDRVLIIQMKGATMSTVANTTYGDITSLNNAGGYEFNNISTVSGNEIFLVNTLTRTYDPANGCVQLIRVPVYNDVSIDGIVTALPWNGSIGGVVVMEVTGTLTFNAGISVSGQGFKGGILNPGNTYSACGASSYSLAALNDASGQKGEGITITAVGSEAGRGKQVNGGGGGMSNNTGGGGGSNAGAGGNGGIQSTGCGTGGAPGIAGLSLTYSNAAGRIFLGGGGGSGQQNNLLGGGPASNQAGGTAGANGGGIVIIKANIIEGNSQAIEAKGNEPAYRAIGDSGGGGGGGGAVLVSYTTLNSGFSVDVSGGKGGDVDSEAPSPYTRRLGCGGGGGGGVFWTSKTVLDPLITVTNTGGAKGICGYYTYSPTTYHLFATAQQTAVAGNTGTVVTDLVLNEAIGTCSPLPVSLLYFKGKQTDNHIDFTWATVQELNNLKFILQRSKDGVQYETIHTAPGSASSVNLIEYKYNDHIVYQGMLYYRLLQVDIDGTTTLTGSLYFDMNSQSSVHLIYPNPSDNGVLYIELKDDAQPIGLFFTDVTGRNLTLPYHQEGRLITVQTGSLSTGVYNLHLQNREAPEVFQILIRQ